MAIEIWVRSTEALRRRSSAFILWGVAMLLFGAAVLVWPGLTGAVLVTLIGAVVLIAGLALLYGAWRLREATGPLWLAALVPALAVTVFGLAVLAFPDAVSTILLLIVAVLAVLAGIGDLASAFALSSVVRWWWLELLRGALLVVAGAWVVFSDVSGLVATGALVGVWALLLGAITVVFGVLALRA